jgi:CRISPR type I-E-associated protein CasB/Cse2
MTPENDSRAANGAAPDLRTVVNRAAHAVDRALSPGDVAALRRLDAEDPSAPAFFKAAAQLLEGVLADRDPARSQDERRWAAILSALAVAKGLHRPGRPLGAALAAGGFAELRLTRLLRARGDQVFPAVRGAAQFLAAKAEPFDALHLALLVLSEGRADEEKVRRDVARSFYKPTQRS